MFFHRVKIAGELWMRGVVVLEGWRWVRYRRGFKRKLAKLPSRVEHILIVRLSAIGDVAMATSLLPPLRRAYPDAKIYWLTEEIGAELLEENRYIERVIVAPRRRWRIFSKERKYLQLSRELWRFARELRRLKPDLTLDAQGLLRSGLWARIAGGKYRIGLGSKEGSQVLMHAVVDPQLDHRGRMCHEYRNLIEHLGIVVEPFELGLNPSSRAIRAAQELLSPGTKKPILLFPFTTRPQKHWFEERWVELSKRFASDGHPVWILGGPHDEEAAKRMAEASGGAITKVVAGWQSNLGEKMGIIHCAAGSVGVDTGLSHISIGLKTPTVVLFGSTCGYVDASPLPGKILYTWMDCSPCRRHPTCNGAFTCMRQLTVDAAYKALKEAMR